MVSFGGNGKVLETAGGDGVEHGEWTKPADTVYYQTVYIMSCEFKTLKKK